MLLLLPFYIIIQKQIFFKVKNNNNNNSIKTSLTKQTTNGTDRPSSGEGAPQGAGDNNADALTVGGNGSAHPPPPSNASWARCVPSAPGAAPAGWSVAGWGPSGQWSSCPPVASLGRQVPYTSPYRPENSGTQNHSDTHSGLGWQAVHNNNNNNFIFYSTSATITWALNSVQTHKCNKTRINMLRKLA